MNQNPNADYNTILVDCRSFRDTFVLEKERLCVILLTEFLTDYLKSLDVFVLMNLPGLHMNSLVMLSGEKTGSLYWTPFFATYV